ncbi:MAG: hypothetical protein QM779_08330 [Propionicimonas sp.]|uniref:hypothetical protein n=1 Tax=Propionicimonas sp. TaxID=1955623 RepID=UPI003D0FA044
MPERRTVRERVVEVLAVALLGVATVCTAWCALQSNMWSAEQQRLTGVAQADQLESTRLLGVATQTMAYDGSTVASYAAAVATGNQKLTAFYRSALVRKGFLEYLDAWQKDITAGTTPSNLLENKEYLDGVLGPYREATAKGDQASADADHAASVGEGYVLTTVLLAVALFFAGVTGTFRSPILRLLLVSAAFVAISVAIGHIGELPVAPGTLTMLTGP